jgi:hypothetical protein
MPASLLDSQGSDSIFFPTRRECASRWKKMELKLSWTKKEALDHSTRMVSGVDVVGNCIHRTSCKSVTCDVGQSRVLDIGAGWISVRPHRRYVVRRHFGPGRRPCRLPADEGWRLALRPAWCSYISVSIFLRPRLWPHALARDRSSCSEARP